MTLAAGAAVLQIELWVEVGKNNSVKDYSVTWQDEAGDTVPFHSGTPRFQSIEVFCGDVEFGAVSAELDFVNALMETVSNDFVYFRVYYMTYNVRFLVLIR